MEFWPENQGQSHLYSKFGTVPGKNCTPHYPDRHQAAHYPLYYGEQQQDQCRESTYWAGPGSRTVGALPEYTNWTDADLTVPPSPHFPFVLDRHAHQDLSEYQPHDAREWTAAHRGGARDYERALQRDGWQRRWEPCVPVRYNRDVSAKRSDSSYRELEAWAARYSHSLPRRRRIEAELRGASQGGVEGRRSGAEHQVAAVQHARQSTSIREAGLWDRGGRNQAPASYQPHASAPDARHVLDVKDSYHRRLFSQPPCYIAPPPYNSPHKSSPAAQQRDPSWPRDTRRQTLWSPPTVRQQDVSAHKEEAEKEGLTKAEGNKSHIKLEGLMHQREEAERLPTGSDIMHTELERTPHLPRPPATQAPKITEDTSKVIEGRKFRLNKKMGGMTIFCLVSRIAGTAETSSLPLCNSQINVESKETTEIYEGLGDTAEGNQTDKLADEVDLPVPNLMEHSNTFDVTELTGKTQETQTSTENQKFEDPESVSTEKPDANDDFTLVRQAGQSVQPASVKYPLWREPSFTSRAESSSTSCAKENGTQEESNKARERQGVTDVGGHPIDIEVRRLDIQEASESEGLLVIDTTCVVVKMELIQSPKKEHVHYLASTDGTSNIERLNSFESNSQENADMTTAEDSRGPSSPTDAALTEKEESEILSPSESPRVSETLEERAERILGIPLHECFTEHHPQDATSNIDPDEEQDDKTEPSFRGNFENDESKQSQCDMTEVKPEKSCLQLMQTEDATCMKGEDDTGDQVRSEDAENSTAYQERVWDNPGENKTGPGLELDPKTFTQPEMSEECQLEFTVEREKCDRGQAEDQSDNQSSQPTETLNASSPSGFASQSFVLESNGGNFPPPGSSLQSPLDQLHSSFPPEPRDSSPHTQQSSSTLPLDSPLCAESLSDAEDRNEGGEKENKMDNHETNMADKVLSEQQCDCADLDDVAVTDEQQSKEESEEEPGSVLDHKVETSEEKRIDATTKQPESVQTERAICAGETNTAGDQPPGEHSEALPDFQEESMETDEQEKLNECGEEDKTSDHQFDHDPKELPPECRNTTEDPSQNEPAELPEGLQKQMMDSSIAADTQTQTETENLQEDEAQTELSVSSPASASDCQESLNDSALPELQSPPDSHEPDSETLTLLDVGSACKSLMNPDTAAAVSGGITDSPEESVQASSSPLTHSPFALAPSTTLLPQEEEVSAEFSPLDAQKEELQYPKSLWDVVNRIRKHTAPDSENEEEEMTEPWDPENGGEEFGGLSAAADSELMDFDECQQRNVSLDSAGAGRVRRGHKDSALHADEDTLSCSSTSSHGSDDTVIIADEDEVEEAALDARTESKLPEDNEAFITTEGKLCISDDARTERKNEQGGEVRDSVEPDQSEPACPSETQSESTESTGKDAD